ncbi:IclR family transcriptional regulator [Nocardia sp. NPDC057227]|uniref:IclR family transcriptional regulator n=1 Tax=Nocardia sp. NPDC057227 TaxID=3346056 RepID=UPI00362DC4E4
MVAVLEVFDSEYSTPSLEQVCRRTGLPRSTAHRILDQLIARNWVTRAATGYRLGAGPLYLAGARAIRSVLCATAAPILEGLARTSGRGVQLALMDGADIRYLDQFGAGSGALVGQRAPAHRTALGKAMLARMCPDDVDQLYCAARGVPPRRELHAELFQVRSRRGVAIERGEYVAGLACVSAALQVPAGPVAAISAVGDPGTRIERLIPAVVAAARGIEKALR